jgi:hypothetical protein
MPLAGSSAMTGRDAMAGFPLVPQFEIVTATLHRAGGDPLLAALGVLPHAKDETSAIES